MDRRDPFDTGSDVGCAMDLGLLGKVAIVTGGGTGIGRATAIRLTQEGAAVAVCGRRPAPLEEVVRQITASGGRALAVTADVADVAGLERIVHATVEEFGGIDVLVNNAGTSMARRFGQLDLSSWRADLDVKLFAQVALTRLVHPHMLARGGGAIVNITIPAARAPSAASMPSSVSRAAAFAFSKALAHDLGADRIRVNTVAVGAVRADQHAHLAQRNGHTIEEHYAQLADRVPLCRIGEPMEVANVVAFLASDAASFVTGTNVNVDGGRSPVM
jgi:3-oxoacyl-[acyl-carrier protein] reductase